MDAITIPQTSSHRPLNKSRVTSRQPEHIKKFSAPAHHARLESGQVAGLWQFQGSRILAGVLKFGVPIMGSEFLGPEHSETFLCRAR
ncbi:hypothetical protein OPQ81_001193 [Rhizoctonia solani]|nr:hypothetical protein OPQ81_001193 [Rhizoctonia solani]